MSTYKPNAEPALNGSNSIESNPASNVPSTDEFDNLVEIYHLRKDFGTVLAVDDLSFSIKPGEVFGLLGPNGAGKTTTIKTILGLISPTSGEIRVFGLDPEEDAVEIKKRIGYISEEPLMYKSLTPKELFNFVSSIRKLDPKSVSEKLANYLESLGAVEHYNKLIATLSRGNKQKMQIIAALLHDPDLLIMDEPMAGLDAKSVKVVKEIIKMHKERGGSIIFSTHIMEVAQEVCDRILIINKGKPVALGTLEELRAIANEENYSLEDIFLKLTEADSSIQALLAKLKKSLNK